MSTKINYHFPSLRLQPQNNYLILNASLYCHDFFVLGALLTTAKAQIEFPCPHPKYLLHALVPIRSDQYTAKAQEWI